MSREKQIEEMTKLTCQMYCRGRDKKCGGVQDCDCKCLHYNRCEALYNAGYRKQSEGEWVVKAYPVDSDEVIIIPYKEHQHNEPYCSICGEYALLNGGEEYVTSNFCPNCGAKMKGGAE